MDRPLERQRRPAAGRLEHVHVLAVDEPAGRVPRRPGRLQRVAGGPGGARQQRAAAATASAAGPSAAASTPAAAARDPVPRPTRDRHAAGQGASPDPPGELLARPRATRPRPFSASRKGRGAESARGPAAFARPQGQAGRRPPLAPLGDDHARETERAAGDGEHGRRLAEQGPAEQDRDGRHEVGHRAHPAGRRARERVAPGQEAERHRRDREVDHPADRRRRHVRQLAAESARERQADDGAEGAGEPRHLERRDTREQRLLRDDSDRVTDGGGKAQDGAPARREPAVGCRAADDDHAREGDRHAGDEAWRKALAQDEAGEDGDQDRPDVDEHRGRARVHASLGLVESDVVEAEPEDADEGDHSQITSRGQRLAAPENDQPERQARDRQPAERERAGREVLSCVADADERRGPERDGDECGAEGEQALAIGGRTGCRRERGHRE